MTGSVPDSTRTAAVAIIGGGPGGYVAAIRCGQAGLDTVLIDDQPLGGTCLNVGCIPSKALIHVAEEFHTLTRSARADSPSPLGISAADPAIDLKLTSTWMGGIVSRLNRGVGSLVKRAGAELMVGRATMVDGKTCDVTGPDGSRHRVKADHIVIATGSQPLELPGLAFGGPVISSTGALALTEVPSTMVVVGGGYIGVELGTAWAKLGARVTIVEAEERLLPHLDTELSAPVVRRLNELGVTMVTSARAGGRSANGLEVADGEGRTVEIEAETILVTVGRRPVTSGWGLETLALAMDGPFIAVDGQGRSSMHNVWAVGDVTGDPMLAHRAMAQGEVVADAISDETPDPFPVDEPVVPAIVYADPEIVVVGLSPAEAEARYGSAVVGRFPLAANGRAMTLERTTGFVRVVARPDNQVVVGIQAVGAAVAELSGSFTMALEMGARLEDLAGIMQAHPTMGEALAEAAFDALGRPLHR